MRRSLRAPAATLAQLCLGGTPRLRGRPTLGRHPALRMDRSRPGPLMRPRATPWALGRIPSYCPAQSCPAAPARTAASALRSLARSPSALRPQSDSTRATVWCRAARSLPRTARAAPLPIAYKGTTGRSASAPAARAAGSFVGPATCASRWVCSSGRCAYPDVSITPAARLARPASPYPAARWASAAILHARWAILARWPPIVRRTGCAYPRPISAGPTAIA
jgi:hypothetical protein